MKRLLRVLLALAALIAFVAGGLYVFVSPNARAEDGPADPILGVRRPVVKFLRDVGILLNGPIVFFGDPYLPTVVTASMEEDATDPRAHGEKGVVTEVITVRREPVWRGLFWLVGDRVTYRDEFLGDDRHDISALRLCCEEAGRREVVGEGTVENGGIDPDGRWASVQGYVPHSADSYWVEWVGSGGAVRDRWSWGSERVEAP